MRPVLGRLVRPLLAGHHRLGLPRPLLQHRNCATDASGRYTIGAALKHAVMPERNWFAALLWRGIRVARIGFLATAIYGAGKTAGHTEVLEDPDGIAKQVITEIIVQTHHDKKGEKKNPSYYKRGSAVRQRVEAVGNRVLAAAREEVAALLEKLPKPASALDMDPHGAERAELLKAQKRLAGKWHWIVTTSALPNAFVTPMCPRRVFVTEGLLEHVQPTDDGVPQTLELDASTRRSERWLCLRPKPPPLLTRFLRAPPHPTPTTNPHRRARLPHRARALARAARPQPEVDRRDGADGDAAGASTPPPSSL